MLKFRTNTFDQNIKKWLYHKFSEVNKAPVFYDLNFMRRKKTSVRPVKDTVRLQCRAEAKSPVYYIWLKNGRTIKKVTPTQASNEISTNDVSSTGETNVGDLVLQNLKIRDGGQYKCIAFNPHGNVSFTYEVKIVREYCILFPEVYFSQVI